MTAEAGWPHPGHARVHGPHHQGLLWLGAEMMSFSSWLQIPGFLQSHLSRSGPELRPSWKCLRAGAGPPSLLWGPVSQASGPPEALLAPTSFYLIAEGELISYKLALLFNSSALSGAYRREPSGAWFAGLLILSCDFNNSPRVFFNTVMVMMVACGHSSIPSRGASAT